MGSGRVGKEERGSIRGGEGMEMGGRARDLDINFV